jgi:hypothetical protein
VSYLADLNVYLGAWPIPILLVLAASLWFAPRQNRWDGLMAGLFASQLIGYALYWGIGSFLGPRFLYTAVPALAIMIGRLPSHLGRARNAGTEARAVRMLALAVAITWLVPGVTENALGLAKQAAAARANLRVDYAGVTADAEIHNAIVFLREPFTARLARRLWGVGALRSDAARLVSTRDACVLHDSLEVIEREGRKGAAAASAIIGIPAFDRSVAREQTADPRALVASARVSASCAQELADDRRFGFSPFGPALPLVPFTEDGRVGGDVIYVADLGSHNAALRERFGARRWYRLVLTPAGPGRLAGQLVDY